MPFFVAKANFDTQFLIFSQFLSSCQPPLKVSPKSGILSYIFAVKFMLDINFCSKVASSVFSFVIHFKSSAKTNDIFLAFITLGGLRNGLRVVSVPYFSVALNLFSLYIVGRFSTIFGFWHILGPGLFVANTLDLRTINS